MGANKKTVSGMVTLSALERQAQFLCEKRSGLYVEVLPRSIATENCVWRQEAGKDLALPRLNRLARKVWR